MISNKLCYSTLQLIDRSLKFTHIDYYREQEAVGISQYSMESTTIKRLHAFRWLISLLVVSLVAIIEAKSSVHERMLFPTNESTPNPFDLIEQIHFTTNDSIFFMTKDHKQFGYIDQVHGELFNLFELGEHQKILNKNPKSHQLIIRNELKSLTTFNYDKGEQIIDEKSHIFEDDNSFNEILSFIQPNPYSFYILTDKDLRFCSKQHLMDQKQTVSLEDNQRSEQTPTDSHRKVGINDDEESGNNTVEKLHQQNQEVVQQKHNKTCESSSEFVKIFEQPKNHQTSSSIFQRLLSKPKEVTLLYDLIEFPLDNQNQEVTLISLQLSKSLKKIQFRQFQNGQLVNNEQTQKFQVLVNSANLKSIRTTEDYLYLQFGNELQVKNTNLSEQKILALEQILSEETQIKQQQTGKEESSKIWNLKPHSTLVLNSKLEVVELIKRQIQQFENGNAVFANHETYNPQYGAYFEYRAIDTNYHSGSVKDDLRAIVSKRQIWLVDYVPEFQYSQGGNQEQDFVQRGKDQPLEKFTARILENEDKEHLEPISMFAKKFNKQISPSFHTRYLLLIQFNNLEIAMYELNPEELNSNFVHHENLRQNNLEPSSDLNSVSITKDKAQQQQKEVNNSAEDRKINTSSVKGGAGFGQAVQQRSTINKLWEIDSLSKLVEQSEYEDEQEEEEQEANSQKIEEQEDQTVSDEHPVAEFRNQQELIDEGQQEGSLAEDEQFKAESMKNKTLNTQKQKLNITDDL